MGFLEFQPGKCSWLDVVELGIRHLYHIGLMSMGSNTFRCNMLCRKDIRHRFGIQLKLNFKVKLRKRFIILFLTFVAHSLRVTSPSWWTVAQWSVEGNSTFSVLCTWITFSTWILTLFVDAGCVN